MKNKKFSKIILLALLAIFAVVLYIRFANFNATEENNHSQPTTSFTPPKAKAKSNFSLLPIERDPFLGGLYSNSKKKKKKIKTNIPIKNKKPWPLVKYQGLVSNKNATKQIFMLTVNGKQQLLSKGDTFNEVEVVKGTAEKILVRYQGKTKEFNLE